MSALLGLALREPGTLLKVAKLLKVARRLVLAKLVEVMEPEVKRPWHAWADKRAARYVYEVLAREGVARWREDGSLEVVKRPRPPADLPVEVADAAPLLDRLLPHLPEALEGRRRYFTDRELMLAYAKFLDNLGYNWFRRLALSLLLPKELRRREDAVFVDVGAGMGLSTLALLELTRGAVIAVDPYEENLESVRDYAAVHRVERRVRTLRGYAEDFELEAPADAAVMINVLHWCNSPQLALRNAARNVKRGGYVALAQAVLARYSYVGDIIVYLLGAPRFPPTRRELHRMIADEGLKVEKRVNLAWELVLAKVP